MRLQRHWWRFKKNISNWFGYWKFRNGFGQPFGKCPQCKVGLRYGVDQQVVDNLDGTTTVVAETFVRCPKCGFAAK